MEIQRESRKECAKSQALRTMKGRPLLTIYGQVGNNRGSSNRGIGGSRSSQVERLKKPKNLQAERASRKDGRDLPGGAMDKNAFIRKCRGQGSIPGPRRFHVPWRN